MPPNYLRLVTALAILAAAVLIGIVGARLARGLLGIAVRRTATEWDDVVLARLAAPISAGAVLLAAALLMPLAPIGADASAEAARSFRVGFGIVLFWAIWRSSISPAARCPRRAGRAPAGIANARAARRARREGSRRRVRARAHTVDARLSRHQSARRSRHRRTRRRRSRRRRPSRISLVRFRSGSISRSVKASS